MFSDELYKTNLTLCACEIILLLLLIIENEFTLFCDSSALFNVSPFLSDQLNEIFGEALWPDKTHTAEASDASHRIGNQDLLNGVSSLTLMSNIVISHAFHSRWYPSTN